MSHRRVMILDDQILDVLRAEKALKAAGYEVKKLTTPHGALAKIEFEQPELLLLNITMSRLNVTALLGSLRASPDYQDLIVVLFSDMEAEELQQYCLDNDIHGYYCKSMNIDKIAEFIDNFYDEEDFAEAAVSDAREVEPLGRGKRDAEAFGAPVDDFIGGAAPEEGVLPDDFQDEELFGDGDIEDLAGLEEIDYDDLGDDF